MTTEAKVESGVSAEQVDQWHLAWRDIKNQPRALDYIAQRAYEKGIADGMERASANFTARLTLLHRNKCVADNCMLDGGTEHMLAFSEPASIGEKQ